MINRVPLTGILKLDIAIAFIVACQGLYLIIKFDSRWGWVVLGSAAFWGYLIFQRL